jgi:hypothetical protein
MMSDIVFKNNEKGNPKGAGNGKRGAKGLLRSPLDEERVPHRDFFRDG